MRDPTKRSSDPGQRLAGELAKAANITEEKALRVLQVLHLDKLSENLDAIGRVLADPAAVNVLGLGVAARRELGSIAQGTSVSIENLRIGVKPTGRIAGPVA